MKKYVILIDVDGTLTESSKKEVSKKVVEGLRLAKEKGHILAIATGRVLEPTKQLGLDKEFNYYACLMGTTIYNVDTDSFEFINENRINSKYVEELMYYFHNSNMIWTYKGKCKEFTTYVNKNGTNKYGAELVSIEKVKKDIENNEIFQLLADKHLINQDIINKYPDLSFIEMPAGYYDILKKGQSKADIVKYFRKRYPDYTIVAIGDSNNDIDMFKTCDISIAMGNSKDDIKQMCDYVTKSVQEDGVYYALTEILDIK